MIQFKVIRASRLLLALAVILLIVVLAVFGFRFLTQRQAPPANSAARLVEMNAIDEVETNGPRGKRHNGS